MCVSDARGQDAGVVITVRLDATDPPAGEASLSGGQPVAFVGWLGLVSALSQLLEVATGS